FTAERAMTLTQLTKRRIQYWDETGLVRPSLSAGTGRGHRRLYDFRDLVSLRTAARLRTQGISLQLIRKVNRHLRALDYEKPLAELRFWVDDRGDLLFVESGTTRRARQPEQTLVSVTVNVPELVSELNAAIAKLDKRRAGATERRRATLGGKEVFAGTRIPVATVQ